MNTDFENIDVLVQFLISKGINDYIIDNDNSTLILKEKLFIFKDYKLIRNLIDDIKSFLLKNR